MEEESRARSCSQDGPLKPLGHLKIANRETVQCDSEGVELTWLGVRALMPYIDLSSPCWLFMASLTSGVSVNMGQRATILTLVLV